MQGVYTSETGCRSCEKILHRKLLISSTWTPPFNSKRLYNAYIGGAQWVAFTDTWRWSEAIGDFEEMASRVDMADLMESLRTILGEGPNLAYLSYMANRLYECRRVLKDTGSIYLHCDPTFSHYLKIVMDRIFGCENFKREVVWSNEDQSGFKSLASNWVRGHDTLLFYARSRKSLKFHKQYRPLDEKTIKRYDKVDEKGKRFKIYRNKDGSERWV